MNIYKYFTPQELACKCGQCNSNGLEMNPAFMSRLDQLRDIVGFPLIVSSAYRCPQYNNRVSMTGLNGPHTTGKAIDFLLSREEAYDVLRAALEFGFSGIGVNQKGDHRFLHLDTLTQKDGFVRPTVWSY